MIQKRDPLGNLYKNIFENVFENILDWIYPPTCICCKRLLPLNEKPRYICNECKPLFVPVSGSVCQKCGKPGSAFCGDCERTRRCFASNTAVFVYEGLVQELLHDMKFRSKKRTAWGLGLLWGEIVKSRNTSAFETPGDTVFVPVPMYRKKKSERGFNQSEVMARALGFVLGVPVENMLTRTVDTPPMAGLPRAMRTENVAGVFQIRQVYAKTACKTKEIILVDDIYTTGASLNECAKTLMTAGFDSISAMTLSVSVQSQSPISNSSKC